MDVFTSKNKMAEDPINIPDDGQTFSGQLKNQHIL